MMQTNTYSPNLVDNVHERNPIGMTTAEITEATEYINGHIEWLRAEFGSSANYTHLRARLAALRAELIRRTS